ncbi:hypothetical protein [Ancylobacter oerskovii]|uniref:ParB/Sulfiredoxin domain-containing protein n=1 Tax=Ancylobacter oerskovii TaxID=459519 RepID=A0ABW4Z4B5_9HYPH|nr:hypothetical protein [Ancylobacter oerskovii]MBS7545734.1 hypothetical protein [Ancylobacter oerskovii]
MQIDTIKVSPSDLLLDPNNYRFHDIQGYRAVSKSRYAEPGAQERALQFLRDTPAFDLNALRDSIISNGFVPFEQIVVEKYHVPEGGFKYLVIEGNRRAAALKTILKDYNESTLDLSPEKLATIENISVIEITGSESERQGYQKTLMAIRHVAGIREWGPYQQARLVVEMYDQEEGAFGPVAQRIGITSREVARRYRASKALQQMEKDDEFGEYAAPKLYSFFHEAVSQPKVREWLKFSDTSYMAEDADARRVFYELLSPRETVDGRQAPKLQNANQQVRQLKDIVDKPIPLKILSDPERSFSEAVRAAEAELPTDETGALEHALGTALQALRQPSIDAWLSPDTRAVQIWEDLVSLVDKVRPLISKKNDTQINS